jgi:hypothetical protein
MACSAPDNAYPSLYFPKGGAKKGEPNPGFIRLLEVGEIDVALGQQIRFNIRAQSLGGEE